MSLLLHVSDLHFGTERPEVVEALVRLSQALQPTMMVMSGDITQRARADEFEAAVAFERRMGVPSVVIPGNHDIPLFHVIDRVFHPYGQHQNAFGQDLDPQRYLAPWWVVSVNTTRAYRHKNGEISVAQIEQVVRSLKQAPADVVKVVVVHQPLEVMREEDVEDRLRGHYREAQQAWSSAGADVILGGHIHYPYVMQLTDVARATWVVQAGTAVSERVRDGVPNSVNVLRHHVEMNDNVPVMHVDVEQWDFEASSQSFEKVLTSTLTLQR